MTRRRPFVSDHAVIRYMERILGIDVEAHRRAVEALVEQAVELGACSLVRGGFRYRIRGDRVTTVVPVSHDPEFPSQKPVEEEE